MFAEDRPDDLPFQDPRFWSSPAHHCPNIPPPASQVGQSIPEAPPPHRLMVLSWAHSRHTVLATSSIKVVKMWETPIRDGKYLLPQCPCAPSVQHHMMVWHLPSGPWGPLHCPVSILIGQCHRYQSFNSISCLALIVFVVTVIIYGLPSSETFIPRNSALPPTISRWLLLLLLLHSRFLPSAHPFNNGIFWLHTIAESSHPQPWLHLRWLGICQMSHICRYVWVVDSAGLDLCFPPSPSLHSSGLVWPQEMFYRRLGRQKQRQFLFYSPKVAAGQQVLMPLIHWSPSSAWGNSQAGSSPSFCRISPISFSLC